MESKKSTSQRKRAGGVCIALSALFLLLAVRITLIQIFDHAEYEQIVTDQITQETSLDALRGNIYDTNGIAIATNITTYRLFVDPAAIKRQSDEDGVNYTEIISKGLAAIGELELTAEAVAKQCSYTKYRDRTVARHISEEVADAVRAFIDESSLDDLALVHLQATSKRYYPYGTLACHVLGFTGGDGSGLYGLEYQYDEVLRGTDGKYVGAKDSYGNDMEYDYESLIPAIDGYNITTTIDVYIQAELEEQLETTYIESGGKNRACGIVMDTETGAILAMAVYPSYDLNDPWKLNWECVSRLNSSGLDKDSDEYAALEQQLLLETWSNKAINEMYYPGSTYKVITAAMAYEEDLVIDDELFNCPGYHYVLGQKIHCHYHPGHGNVTFARGLQQSCNPVLMMMGERIGAATYLEYFNAFGYLEKSGIDIAGESVTKLGSTFWSEEDFLESSLSPLNLAVASFGQNFKISPVSHLTAINAVANDGYLVEPHFIKEITDGEGNVIYSYETNVRRQVISEATSEKVSAVLEDGVSGDGGAKNAYVAGYRVAAKTGTSEKKDTNSEYTDTPYVCSTVAYAPADAPKITALILVDEPTEGVLYASTIAAPYIANLFAEVLPYYGVEPKYTEEELKNQTLQTPALVQARVETAKDLALLLGFEVEVIGDGEYVKAQSPAYGTDVEPGSAKIILYTTDEAISEKKTVKVPDLCGMTAVAANGTLTNLGLNIKILGTKNFSYGKGAAVIEQFPAAGEVVEEGSVVEVTFRYLDDSDN